VQVDKTVVFASVFAIAFSSLNTMITELTFEICESIAILRLCKLTKKLYSLVCLLTHFLYTMTVELDFEIFGPVCESHIVQTDKTFVFATVFATKFTVLLYI